MPFPLVNVVWALVKKNKIMCIMVASLNKIILWKKFSAMMELEITPRTEKLRDFTKHTCSKG